MKLTPVAAFALAFLLGAPLYKGYAGKPQESYCTPAYELYPGDDPYPFALSANAFDLTVPAVRLNTEGDINARGNYNEGVYRLRLKDGRTVALKLAHTGSFTAGAKQKTAPFDGNSFDHPGFHDSLRFHHYFSRRGKAPALEGVVKQSELQPLIAQLRAQGHAIGDDVGVVGIVMGEMDEPWAIGRTEDGIPGAMAQWDQATIARLLGEIRALRDDLEFLGTDAIDEQFFLTRGPDGNPRVLIADFDHLRKLPAGTTERITVTYAFKGLVEAWEKRSGHTFPDAEYVRATGEKRVR